jgi:hypothetical protein
MLFIAEAFDGSGNRVLGSDGINKFSLKTTKGAQNRVRRFLWSERTKEVKIFRVPFGPYFSEKKKLYSFSLYY